MDIYDRKVFRELIFPSYFGVSIGSFMINNNPTMLFFIGEI